MFLDERVSVGISGEIGEDKWHGIRSSNQSQKL